MQICLFDYLGYSVCKATYIVNLEEAFLLFLDVMGHQQCATSDLMCSIFTDIPFPIFINNFLFQTKCEMFSLFPLP